MSEHNRLILRKLDDIEKFVNRRNTAQNFMSTFRIVSTIDLFSDIDLLKKSIQIWKNEHKFLRANVVRLDVQTDDFYYVIEDVNSSTPTLDNVRFVRFESTNANTDSLLIDCIHDLILEKCLSHDVINFEKSPQGLLWRMIFMQIPSIDPTRFAYEIFTQYHHIVSDGTCAYENFAHLLNIIDATFEHRCLEPCKQQHEQIYLGSGKYFKEKQADETWLSRLPKIPRPSFIDLERARRTSYEQRPNELKNVNLVDIESTRLFASIDDLLEMSKSCSLRFKKLILDRDVTTKLIERCRQERVKLTTCLNLVECLALRRLYDIYGDKSLAEIVYYTAASLRPFLNVDSSTMGYCVGRLISVLTDEHDLTEEGEKFWERARPISDEFQNRLINSNEKFSIKLQSLDDPETELSTHINISNMGVLDTKLIKSAKFKLERRFLCPSIGREQCGYFFFNHLSTVENRLCWIFTYNSYFIDRPLIHEFITFTQEILLKIIE